MSIASPPTSRFGSSKPNIRPDRCDYELGFHREIALAIPFDVGNDSTRPRIFCRIHACESKAPIAQDFTAIRIGHAVSGLAHKAISGKHASQLVAWGKVSASTDAFPRAIVASRIPSV